MGDKKIGGEVELQTFHIISAGNVEEEEKVERVTQATQNSIHQGGEAFRVTAGKKMNEISLKFKEGINTLLVKTQCLAQYIFEKIRGGEANAKQSIWWNQNDGAEKIKGDVANIKGVSPVMRSYLESFLEGVDKETEQLRGVPDLQINNEYHSKRIHLEKKDQFTYEITVTLELKDKNGNTHEQRLTRSFHQGPLSLEESDQSQTGKKINAWTLHIEHTHERRKVTSLMDTPLHELATSSKPSREKTESSPVIKGNEPLIQVPRNEESINTDPD